MLRLRRLLVLAAFAGSLALGAASPALAAAGSAATVTHYTASYTCECFGTFTIEGVHLTNTRFPGADSGGGDAVGGRDNFSGTVTAPPPVELVLDYANAGDWCSDYDGQCTRDWSVTFEPDGSLSGWAVYPNS